MSEDPIIIAGIPIPFRNPVLLAILAVHVAAGLAGTISGILAMVNKKGPGRHPLFGMLYYRCLLVLHPDAGGILHG
jgi:hypothetical protein